MTCTVHAEPTYLHVNACNLSIWTASSKFGTYCLCEQRRFRRACASAQSRQNLRCSLIQAASQEEPSDRKPDPWPLWMAGHAQLKFVMTECSKTQIRLTGLILKGIPFILTKIICWMFIKRSSNFHRIPGPYPRVIKNLYDFLGQPSNNMNSGMHFWVNYYGFNREI